MINYIKRLYFSEIESLKQSWHKSHSKRTNNNIETLRGITIILVVIGHVIGSASDGGMKVSDDSFLRYLYCLLENIRLPLFTAISGWVYALDPVKVGNLSIFISKKARRILIPMVFVGTLYFLVQYLMPGTNDKSSLSQIWKIYLFPYTLYWYLPSLFLIFVLMSVVDIFKIADKFKGWLLVLFVAMIISFGQKELLSQDFPNYFSFKGAMFLLPFFVLGLGVKRFSGQLCSPPMKSVWLYGFVCGVIVQQLQWFGVVNNTVEIYVILKIVIGLISALFLLNLTYSNKALMWMGSYAYTIYLFHAFGTAGGRIILSRLQIDSTISVFVLSLVLGLFVPIIVDIVLSKNSIMGVLFLGKKRDKVWK